MRKNTINKKGLILFLFFLAFGFWGFNISNRIGDHDSYLSKNTFIVENDAQECLTCGQGSEKYVNPLVKDSGSYVFYDFNEEEVVDVSEDVLNASTGSMKELCEDSANTIDKVRRLCSGSTADINHLERLGAVGSGGGSQVDVSKITGFKLVRVTYPLAFWLGKYYMESSNRQITKEDPAFSSNGQVIDADYQQKTLSPDVAESIIKGISYTEREAFDVTGKLEVGGPDEVIENTDGVYTVSNADHDPECGCPREVSKSDYNPGISNYLGSKAGGYDRQQIPNGDNYDNTVDQSCISRGSVKDIQMGLYTGCVKVDSFFKGLFSKVFSLFDWQGCTREGRVECYVDNNLSSPREVCTTVYSDCIDTRDLTVYMTPIFGEVYTCEEDECANAFLTYAYKGSLSPDQSESKMEASSDVEKSLMYFVSTPCDAEIDIAGGGSKVVSVKCLWDATPFLMNYRLQAKDMSPNQEDFPTYTQYEKAVEKEIVDSAKRYGL